VVWRSDLYRRNEQMLNLSSLDQTRWILQGTMRMVSCARQFAVRFAQYWGWRIGNMTKGFVGSEANFVL
jgi:hypothetical protein